MAGLSILRKLLMKQAMKESAPFQDKGIMSISRSLSGNVDAKVKKWAESAKRQGQDLDKMSEQELKYLIELNKPKAPRVFSNEEAYEFLNKFLNQGKKGEVIKGKFKPLVTVESVITDIKKLKPMDSMKETNKVLKGEGKYKSLSKADREKIAGDESVNDHIFERNIVDETEDFAQGGPAGLSYLLAEDINERMPLAGGGYLPMGMWGDIAEAFEKYQEENKESVGPLMSYKQFWNNYIDNLASGGRVGYAGGGSGKPPINFYVDFSGSGGGKQENFLNVPGLNQSGYNYGGTFGADTTFPFLGGELSVGGEFGIGRNKSDVNYKGQPIDFLSGVGETKLGDDWNVGMKWRKKFAGGGMGRRAFLKLMAALGLSGAAAKFGLPTLFKKATPKVAKEVVKSAGSGTTPPPYFFNLVNKIKNLGDDVTPKYATQERQKITKYKDYELTEDITTGEKTIQKFKPSELDEGPSNMVEETYMNYRPGKGQMDETTKGKTPPDEYTEDTSYIRGDGGNKGGIYKTVDGVGDDVIQEGTVFEDNITEFGKK